MYQFRIKKQADGGFKFELGSIKLLVEDYTITEGKHLLTNPNKAIAYFTIDDNIYGVSNEPMKYDTVEAFYDAINKQYSLFTGDHSRATDNAKEGNQVLTADMHRLNGNTGSQPTV